VSYRNPDKNGQWDSKEIDITEQIKTHLESQKIDIFQPDLREAICECSSVDFFKNFISDIKLVLQIRNSYVNTDVDYMLSPVKNKYNQFFDTRKYCASDDVCKNIPENADANGAYNIARKGLMLINKIRNEHGDKVSLAISNKEWLEFAQSHLLEVEPVCMKKY
jgi:CRISPR-associated protein Cpf1